jgi:UMP-CMP kinase
MPPPHLQLLSILGPPGSGKGTQSALLAHHFRLTHYSIGDMLRLEAANPTSPWAAVISTNMARGTIGPREMTADMLRVRIEDGVKRGENTFLLDGGYFA